MIRLSFSAFVVSGLSFPCIMFAQPAVEKTPPTAQTRPPTKDLRELSVEQLVARLVSPNEAPPESSGSPREKFRPPATYDFGAQYKLCKAAEELLKRGKDAIPELLKHMNDKGYSVSRESPSGAVVNRSGGDHCEHVLRLIVNADDRSGLPEDIQGWWKEHQHLPLWELQAQATRRRLRLARVRADELDELERTHKPIKNDYPWSQMAWREGSVR